ncbi:hypothetical protein L9F63_004995 [Diploptera punctata]|uniref:Uncharacterized protein n=1 Tax=Diploptera punctata TaxID=6984 RepID=A0AAD8E6V1_DIPPU|nr:hypothetical protein L9F63_004995 [Diploptera punctata]
MCTDKSKLNSNLNSTVRDLPILTQDIGIRSISTLKSLCIAVLKQNNQLSSEKLNMPLISSDCSIVSPEIPKFDSDIALNIPENSFNSSCDNLKDVDFHEEKKNKPHTPESKISEKDIIDMAENKNSLVFACDNPEENLSPGRDEKVNSIHKKQDCNVFGSTDPEKTKNDVSTNIDGKLTEPLEPYGSSIKDSVQELIKNIDEITETEPMKTDSNLNDNELLEASDSFDLEENENMCNRKNNTSKIHKEGSFYLSNVGDIGEDLDMSVTSSIPSTPESVEGNFQESEDEMLNIKLKVSDSDDESLSDIPESAELDCNKLTLSPVAVMLKESVDITSDAHAKLPSEDFDKPSNSDDIFASIIEDNITSNEKSELNCPIISSNSETFGNSNKIMLEVNILSPSSSKVCNASSTEVNEDEAQISEQGSTNTILRRENKIDKEELTDICVAELGEVKLLEDLQDNTQSENSDSEKTFTPTADCHLDSFLEFSVESVGSTESQENSLDQSVSISEVSSRIEDISKSGDVETSEPKDEYAIKLHEIILSEDHDQINNSLHKKLEFESLKNKKTEEIVSNPKSDQQQNSLDSHNVKKDY